MKSLEDLHEPLQKLLKAKGGYTDEDVDLCRHAGKEEAGVVCEELGSGRNALDVWEEVKVSLVKRMERRRKKEERAEMLRRQQEQALTPQEAPFPEYIDHPLRVNNSPMPLPSIQAVTGLPNSRYWDAVCPSCHTEYMTPPREWTCPNSRCDNAKVWQPDKGPKSVYCAICPVKLSFMNRHHCRNCGRIICSQCLGRDKVLVPRVQYIYVQKVCAECFDQTLEYHVLDEGGVTTE